jgi:hypothetical protein
LIGKRATYHHDRNKHQKKQRVWEDDYATQDNDYDIVHDNNNNVSQSTVLNLNDYALPGYPEIKMVGEINQKYFQTELRTGLARSFLVGQITI